MTVRFQKRRLRSAGPQTYKHNCRRQPLRVRTTRLHNRAGNAAARAFAPTPPTQRGRRRRARLVFSGSRRHAWETRAVDCTQNCFGAAAPDAKRVLARARLRNVASKLRELPCIQTFSQIGRPRQIRLRCNSARFEVQARARAGPARLRHGSGTSGSCHL